MEHNFGGLLKDWRNRRRMSQLDLGLYANVSAKHIAFLETGRSAPSRSMVVQLSEALNVPRADRNSLLNAAGFASVYQSRNIHDDEMAHVRAAVEWTLKRHHPFPALAVDRHWKLVMVNPAAEMMLGNLGLKVGDSMLEAALESSALRDAVEDWSEVARHMSVRLRTESAHLGGDPVLDAAAEKLAKEAEAKNVDPDTPLQVIVPTRYRAGDMVLSFFTTLAQFGSAEDIALADLKIELFFPADEATKQVLISMGKGDA